MGYSKKIQTRRRGYPGEFPRNDQGYQRNTMWNFQGLIKNKMKFPKGDHDQEQEKIMWKFQGSV